MPLTLPGGQAWFSFTRIGAGYSRAVSKLAGTQMVSVTSVTYLCPQLTFVRPRPGEDVEERRDCMEVINEAKNNVDRYRGFGFQQGVPVGPQNTPNIS